MSDIRKRKQSHLDICLNEDVSGFVDSGFDELRLKHTALPELDMAKIDTSVEFLDKTVLYPFFISSMTGGYERGREITRNLARAAQARGVALGVGSQRVAIEKEDARQTFQVRDVAPDILLFANMGAVQLNYGYGVDEYRRVVEMIEADGLFLHLNPIQEAIQPEGDTDYSGLLKKIEQLVAEIEVPVIVKEVGMGISGEVARQLREVGVRHVDVAGQGGTSWSYIEGVRGDRLLGEVFADWGISTVECIRQCVRVEGIDVIASGGLRTGIDVAKSICLGAKLAGLALPFLEAAAVSDRAVVEEIDRLGKELRVAMLGVGAGSVADLSHDKLSGARL